MNLSFFIRVPRDLSFQAFLERTRKSWSVLFETLQIEQSHVENLYFFSLEWFLSELFWQALAAYTS